METWTIGHPVVPENQRTVAILTHAIPKAPHPASQNFLDRWVLARLNQIVPPVTRSLENSDSLTAAIDLRVFSMTSPTGTSAAAAGVSGRANSIWTRMRPTPPYIMYWSSFPPTGAFYSLCDRGDLSKSGALDLPTSLRKHPPYLMAACGRGGFGSDGADGASRQVASLGLAARNGAGLKVRQPLSQPWPMPPADDLAPRAGRDHYRRAECETVRICRASQPACQLPAAAR